EPQPSGEGHAIVLIGHQHRQPAFRRLGLQNVGGGKRAFHQVHALVGIEVDGQLVLMTRDRKAYPPIPGGERNLRSLLYSSPELVATYLAPRVGLVSGQDVAGKEGEGARRLSPQLTDQTIDVVPRNLVRGRHDVQGASFR